MKCDVQGNKLVFTFDGLEPVTFDADRAQAHHNRAMMHGFEQKIRDTAAIQRKQKDGTVITVTEAMRRDAVSRMVEHLHTSPDWNMRAERVAAQNPVIAAVATKFGITYEQAQAKIANELLGDMAA